MMSVAGRFTGNRADAEDSVQESLLYLIEQAHRLVVSDSLRPWLYPVVRHRAQSRWRDRRLPSDDSRPALRAPSTQTDQNERLRRAVESMSDLLREVLILRVVDGLSVAQTARALDIPEGTVKSRLASAIAILREDPSLGHF